MAKHLHRYFECQASLSVQTLSWKFQLCEYRALQFLWRTKNTNHYPVLQISSHEMVFVCLVVDPNNLERQICNCWATVYAILTAIGVACYSYWQVALNWLLIQDNVVPIPGAKSASQVILYNDRSENHLGSSLVHTSQARNFQNFPGCRSITNEI